MFRIRFSTTSSESRSFADRAARCGGANAVNGVINIITKSAEKTHGTLVTGITGTEERANFAGRHGLALDDRSHFRGFVKHTKRDNSRLTSGSEGSDDWDMQRAGFRYDNDLLSGATLSVQGQIYAGNAGQFVTFPTLTTPFSRSLSNDASLNGQFVLGRWSSQKETESQLTVQTYFDRTVRRDVHANVETYTLDLEAQKRQRFANIHDVVAGVGYRLGRDSIDGTSEVSITPSHDTYHLISVFVQDEISLTDTIKLIAGTKVEYNSFSGFEFQPSMRTLWQVDSKNSVWGAASRAVRTPSRAGVGAILNNSVTPGAPPVQARIFGDKDVGSEELIALELGYKTRLVQALSIDIAAFYNIYDNILTTDPGTAFVETTPAPLHAVLPLTFADNMSGEAYGVEIGGDWRAKEWLRLRAAYTYFELELHRNPGTGLASNEAAEDRDPRHQVSLTGQFDVGNNIEIDATLRAVDRLSERNVSGYATADLRIAWRPNKNVEFSIVGQNLGQSRHREFVPEFLATQETEVERAVYGSVKLKF